MFQRQEQKKIPLVLQPVSAGFPSPADDFIDRKLDLNDLMIQHPSATFFVRVQGASMEGAGIVDRDLLVVDRALEPKNGSIVVALVDGEFTLKRVARRGEELFLAPENKLFQPIRITEDMDFEIWGVVRWVVREV